MSVHNPKQRRGVRGPVVVMHYVPKEFSISDLLERQLDRERVEKGIVSNPAPLSNSINLGGQSRLPIEVPASTPSFVVPDFASADLWTERRTSSFIRERPGQNKDGAPQQKEYSFRVKKAEAAWLRHLAHIFGVTLPTLLLGIGMGWWAIPWHRLAKPSIMMPIEAQKKSSRLTGKPRGRNYKNNQRKNRATITIQIRDDQWDALVKSARATRRRNPDPVRYCVMATLGRVRVPIPGPLLLTGFQRLVMQVMDRAVQQGHRFNPLSEFPPPVENLNRARDGVLQRIIDNGLYDQLDEEAALKSDLNIQNLFSLFEIVERKTELCEDATNDWRKFLQIASRIAQPINEQNNGKI